MDKNRGWQLPESTLREISERSVRAAVAAEIGLRSFEQWVAMRKSEIA